jgi:CDP-diacylglycerol--glycerol-3-phosphate 3-phosphatidyltransferase
MKPKIQIQSPSYLNSANLVSLIRLVLLPAFFYFLYYHIVWEKSASTTGFLSTTYYYVALGLVPIILATDYLDGWLARRFSQVNPLGAFLDPLADKFFAFTAITILAWADQLPVWLAIVVFFKEIFILVGWVLLFILGYNTDIEPNHVGKMATVCQGLLIFSAVLSLPGGIHLNMPGFPLFTIAASINQIWFHILTALLVAISGIFYVLEGLKRAEPETSEAKGGMTLVQIEPLEDESRTKSQTQK